MNDFNPNIEIFRDIATVIDMNDVSNMYRIYYWKVDKNNHILIRFHYPNNMTLEVTARFQGGGIIHIDEGKSYYTILDLNKFYYSPSACQKEFKRILNDIIKPF